MTKTCTWTGVGFPRLVETEKAIGDAVGNRMSPDKCDAVWSRPSMAGANICCSSRISAKARCMGLQRFEEPSSTRPLHILSTSA